MDRFDIGPDGKPCRACFSVEDMMKKGRELAEKRSRDGGSDSNKSGAKVEKEVDSVKAPTRKDCPVDKDELGRSTWNLLHTMSVYYPENPTDDDKTSAKTFMQNLGKTYPCSHCAEGLRQDLEDEPPTVGSRSEFAQWMCRLHNKVNDQVGKPQFDCSKIFERWQDGWKDETGTMENSRMREWDMVAEQFFKDPPMRSKFSKKARNGSLVAPFPRQKQSDDANGIDVILAAVLELTLRKVDISSRARIREDLISFFTQREIVPAVYFTDEYASVRYTVSNALTHILKTGTISRDLRLLSSPILNFIADSNRYAKDFEEWERLGSGGFGSVFKARSRLDNRFYAIKKIKIRTSRDDLTSKVLDEVTTLASLYHKNIVRYHSCWIDRTSGDDQTGFISPSSDPSPVKITELHDSSEITDSSGLPSPITRLPVIESPAVHPSVLDVRHQPIDSPIDQPVFTSPSTSYDPSFSDSVPDQKFKSKFFEESGSSSITTSEDENGSSDANDSDDDAGDGSSSESVEFGSSSGDTERKTSKSLRFTKTTRPRDLESGRKTIAADALVPYSNIRLTVYIQMELCTETLEQYLKKRNQRFSLLGCGVVDGSFNQQLFVQLISALEYIHGNYLIHRDVKPANIFLKHRGDQLCVLLGDFGLACKFDEEEDDDETALEETEHRIARRRRRNSSHHSVGVGTRTYAAPEQLNSNGDYSFPVDIFSAGIVMFETYNVFSTKMEQQKAIGKLRRERCFDEQLLEYWPLMMNVILKMTSPDSEERPTAADILRQFQEDERTTIQSLQEIIRTKDAEILKLRKELARYKFPSNKRS